MNMSGRKSKSKGYRGEHNLVTRLNENQIKAKRVPLSGASYIKGDVVITKLGKAEVKWRKDGFKELYKWLGNNDFLFVKRDRDDYLVVLKIEKWMKLVKKKELDSEIWMVIE